MARNFSDEPTCEENFRAGSRTYGAPLRRQVEAATFEVTDEDADRASVRLTSGRYIEIGFTLSKPGDGWRIDDSDAVPYGDYVPWRLERAISATSRSSVPDRGPAPIQA